MEEQLAVDESETAKSVAPSLFGGCGWIEGMDAGVPGTRGVWLEEREQLEAGVLARDEGRDEVEEECTAGLP